MGPERDRLTLTGEVLPGVGGTEIRFIDFTDCCRIEILNSAGMPGCGCCVAGCCGDSDSAVVSVGAV